MAKFKKYIWASTTMKTCPKHHILAKVGFKFYQILNYPSTFCPRLLKFCQTGEISPNLVTLNKTALSATIGDKFSNL